MAAKLDFVSVLLSFQRAYSCIQMQGQDLGTKSPVLLVGKSCYDRTAQRMSLAFFANMEKPSSAASITHIYIFNG